MQRFESRVAIVTDAGSVGPGWGNGRAIALRLAQEGAKVLAVDRDPGQLAETIERAGNACDCIVGCECDVTRSGDVQTMVAKAPESFGRIDILINNVGGAAAGSPVEVTEQVWDSQVDINLKSVFLTCKHVLPCMVARRHGVIVNVASTSGLRRTGSAQVAYAATKAGVIHFSRVGCSSMLPTGFG